MSTTDLYNPISDADLASAVARLGLTRPGRAELRRAEAQARLRLAATIMKLDDIGEDDPRIVYADADVQSALAAYGQALAAVVRGED